MKICWGELEPPYCNTQRVNNSKMPGNPAKPDNCFDICTNGRLKKEKQSSAQLRRTFITNMNIKHIISIFHCVICSILLYGLYRFSLSKTRISKLQSFYSKCIIQIQYGITRYDPNTNRMTSKKI